VILNEFMNQSLLDMLPAEEPQMDFVLFDEMRGNYLFRQEMTMTEAVEYTARLAKSFCHWLKWQKMSAQAEAALAAKKAQKTDNTGFDQTVRARTYVIRRN
jgi:hypothetical protein